MNRSLQPKSDRYLLEMCEVRNGYKGALVLLYLHSGVKGICVRNVLHSKSSGKRKHRTNSHTHKGVWHLCMTAIMARSIATYGDWMRNLSDYSDKEAWPSAKVRAFIGDSRSMQEGADVLKRYADQEQLNQIRCTAMILSLCVLLWRRVCLWICFWQSENRGVGNLDRPTSES